MRELRAGSRMQRLEEAPQECCLPAHFSWLAQLPFLLHQVHLAQNGTTTDQSDGDSS